RNILLTLFIAGSFLYPTMDMKAQNLPAAVQALMASVDSWEVENREAVKASLGESNLMPRGRWMHEEGISFGSELAAFDAITLPTGIELTWVTTMEFGTEKFAIERQLEDGRFATIYMMDAAGSSNGLKVYRFLDRRNDGIPQQYRLRQIDQNGTNHYSGIVQVFPYSDQLAVLNPEVQQGVIELPLESRIVKVNIWNASGEMVLSMESWEEGIQEIPVQDLEAGEYAILMDTDAGRRSAKIALP
ncbi:MAG: T9SS type A sorting domain-containing protein, partial [Bacteroidota bacterium]